MITFNWDSTLFFSSATPHCKVTAPTRSPATVYIYTTNATYVHDMCIHVLYSLVPRPSLCASVQKLWVVPFDPELRLLCLFFTRSPLAIIIVCSHGGRAWGRGYIVHVYTYVHTHMQNCMHWVSPQVTTTAIIILPSPQEKAWPNIMCMYTLYVGCTDTDIALL